ncbi:MAG: prepilin-type N-terminal cleavage/methylation domain-containing protein [Nodosilinea sp.]
MAAQLPSTALTRWLLQKSKANQRGFTLTELLIAIVVGSLILGTLLYLVVELLGTNAREEKLTQAQQDTKRALDYISRDVREAVYVYSDPTDIVNQLDDEPADTTAVLAFWRLKPIDVGQLPDPCAGATEEICETLKVRQNVYDLVVYFHRDNTDSTIWSGPGRIIRYELTNYSNLNNLTLTDGYSDPSAPNNDFGSWVKGPDDTDGNAVVLTDYIDIHDPNISNVACPSGLTASPDALTDSNNFFVCVREGLVGESNLNQSLYVSLRGSTVNPNPGTTVVFGPSSNASSLPTINTEVQVRGVIEKDN